MMLDIFKRKSKIKESSIEEIKTNSKPLENIDPYCLNCGYCYYGPEDICPRCNSKKNVLVDKAKGKHRDTHWVLSDRASSNDTSIHDCIILDKRDYFEVNGCFYPLKIIKSFDPIDTYMHLVINIDHYYSSYIMVADEDKCVAYKRISTLLEAYNKRNNIGVSS